MLAGVVPYPDGHGPDDGNSLLLSGGSMTKADIADIIHTRIGLSKKDAMDLLESMLEEIKAELARGNDVKLSGFGHFSIRQKSERRGRNPKTGEEIMIAPRKVVTFRASQLLRDRLPTGESGAGET